MRNYYNRKAWREYREKCISLAGDACERCGATGILQIHHPEYQPGLKPWEYPIEFCEVLCRKCHAEIHGKIPPSGGWIILDSDLERNEPSEEIPCGYCQREIRWHFTIYHPNCGELVVGSECAENLSLGIEVKELKSYQRRLRTFIVSPRWSETPKGYKISYREYSVLVYQRGSRWRLKIDNEWGKEDFENISKAKERAFMVIDYRIKKERSVAEQGAALDANSAAVHWRQ